MLKIRKVTSLPTLMFIILNYHSAFAEQGTDTPYKKGLSGYFVVGGGLNRGMATIPS